MAGDITDLQPAQAVLAPEGDGCSAQWPTKSSGRGGCEMAAQHNPETAVSQTADSPEHGAHIGQPIRVEGAVASPGVPVRERCPTAVVCWMEEGEVCRWMTLEGCCVPLDEEVEMSAVVLRSNGQRKALESAGARWVNAGGPGEVSGSWRNVPSGGRRKRIASRREGAERPASPEAGPAVSGSNRGVQDVPLSCRYPTARRLTTGLTKTIASRSLPAGVGLGKRGGKGSWAEWGGQRMTHETGKCTMIDADEAAVLEEALTGLAVRLAGLCALLEEVRGSTSPADAE